MNRNNIEALSRRGLIKLSGIAAVSAIATTNEWHKPLIRAVVLPAHAQTSQCPISDITFAVGDFSINCDDDIDQYLFLNVNQTDCGYILQTSLSDTGTLPADDFSGVSLRRYRNQEDSPAVVLIIFENGATVFGVSRSNACDSIIEDSTDLERPFLASDGSQWQISATLFRSFDSVIVAVTHIEISQIG